MKGIIWVKTTNNGRGYYPNLEKYISSKVNFIGDTTVYNNNEINFKVKNNILYYNNDPINTSKYSHIMLIYCSEILTADAYNKLYDIEEFGKKNGLYIFNPVSNFLVDCDKITFFKTLSAHNIAVPKFIEINSELDLNNIPYKYPYLLRTTIDWGGNNIFYIKNNAELLSAYAALSKNVSVALIPSKVIAVEFYSPYIDELGHNLNCRVVMIGSEILSVLCDPFPKNTWTHRYDEISSSKIDPSTFDHVINISGKDSAGRVFYKATKFLINFVDENRSYFKFVQQKIGLHTIAIDFIIHNGSIILLECNLKLGITPYKVNQFIKYLSDAGDLSKLSYYEEYKNDDIRNANTLNSLFYYPPQNIYIDIDNTISDPTDRIKKWLNTRTGLLDPRYYSDVTIDTQIPFSNSVAKLLYSNFDIIYITARPENKAAIATRKWLVNNEYYYTNIIYSGSLDKKIPYLRADPNIIYYIDDFSKGHESKVIIREDIIKKVQDLRIPYTQILNEGAKDIWISIPDKIKFTYNYPVNNNIKLDNIYNGYICIHDKGSVNNNITLTIFVVSIMGDQLKYAIQSINDIHGISFIVHFIVNINPTSKAYEKMNLLTRTPYFMQLDEDMILFNNVDKLLDEAKSIMVNSPNIFNVCFKLHDSLLGITNNRTLYGVKIFRAAHMKNIKYKNGIASVDRELNHRMISSGNIYHLSDTIAGHHAKYRSNFEIMLKYSKMTSGLLLNNIQPSTIDLLRIFEVIGSISTSALKSFLKTCIDKWKIILNDSDYDNIYSKYNLLVKNYNKIELSRHVRYGFKKYEIKTLDRDEKTILNKESLLMKKKMALDIKKRKIFPNEVKSSNYNDVTYYGIFGILYSLIIGFKYDYEAYPKREFDLIER